MTHHATITSSAATQLERTPSGEVIDWDAIITEDDAPVDNYVTEQHIGLLTDTLYDSWSHSVHGKEFIVAADVGLFFAPDAPPVVPDVFLSLGVNKPADRVQKRNRSYFVWEVGKAPEVVIEIVSNREGEEDGRKLASYARIGVPYYIIFDPTYALSDELLRLYTLRGRRYVELAEFWMPAVELGVTIWTGRHQGVDGDWLRWCDHDAVVIPTAAERVEQERRRAEQERLRAEQERRFAEQERRRAEQERRRAEQAGDRAEQERRRAERLAERLRALGIDDFEEEM